MSLVSQSRYFFFRLKKFLKRRYHKVRGFLAGFTFPYDIASLKKSPVVALPHPVDWKRVMPYEELVAEIGSGHGEFLDSFKSKDSIVVGFEIKSRYYKLSYLKTRGLKNVFLYKVSGYEAIDLLFSDESLSRVVVLFPDPWHKERHHKRRPLTAKWFRRVCKKLKPGGQIIIASDWQEYVDFIREEFTNVTAIYDVEEGVYTPEKFGFPVTHYHQKWIRKKRKFTYFQAIKK